MMDNSSMDTREVIRKEFPKVRTQEDLLALLNKIKLILLGSVNEDTCKPLTISSLNYYKNVKVSLP